MKGVAACGLALLALLAPTVVRSETTQDRVRRLAAAVSSGMSATQVLTEWCARLGLADPPVIRAVLEPSSPKAAGDVTRRLLAAAPTERVRYRRVRLVCGTHVLSEAENWYLPSRLTPDMNRRLDGTDTPFGVVVAPLSFHRQTQAVQFLSGAVGVMRVRALLISGAGAPFSLVVETYGRDLIAVTPPGR